MIFYSYIIAMTTNSENNMNDKLTIAQWALEDRPREKLEAQGAAALSNAELCAILIGSGSKDESAVELMKRILKDCNNSLKTLGKMSINNLMKYKGVGAAKAITLLAACELGKRRVMEKMGDSPSLNSSFDIYEFMLPRMQDLDVEQAWILLMNQNFKLIKAECISHGGFTETAIDIRYVIRQAVVSNATILAVVHNHPSGSPQPSKNDDILTRNLHKACELMRIFFMDHVIVSDGKFYSYHDQGRA